ncbi:MAG: gamma-glutamyltransferase [Allobranchiibius sp.]
MPDQIAVAAPNALSTQAGVQVAQAGGSAVDAAIAALMTAYVTEPGLVSALGGAFINVWPSDGSPIVIDGNCEMPGRGLAEDRFGGGIRELFLNYAGGITVFAGPGSAATPGAFAACAMATERFGRASRADVLAPAISAARDGFTVGSASGSYLRLVGDPLYAFDPVTRAIHFHGDSPVGLGDTMTNADLARTLETLAQQGFSSLYDGDLAEAVADHVQRTGGLLTRADLAAYQAVARPANRTHLGRWDIATNPPPSIGGPVLTTMLRMLAESGTSPAALIDVQTRVLRYREAHLDRAVDLAAAGLHLLHSRSDGDRAALSTSGDTVHVSAVDAGGTACSITSSAGYSSGVTVPGTGLVLNNCLGEPELNRLGLHALPTGTRIASNMAPTTARSTDGGLLAIGSPGADRITTALMQVMGRYCLDDAGLREGIDAPRLHIQLVDDHEVVQYEPDAQIEAQLGGRDAVEHPAHAMYFGGVAAAYRAGDGTLFAAADPRRAAGTAIG